VITQIKNIRLTYQCRFATLARLLIDAEGPMRILRFDTAPVAGLRRAARRIGSRTAIWLKASIRACATTRRHRREVALLQAMDERMLRDLGLTRTDVQGAASTPFWRDPAPLLQDRAGPRGHDRRPALEPGAVPHAPSIVPGVLGGAADLARGPSADVIR
jgi:uncharacterized protein YjiS (DUF1127 family)